jgi:hypothetical protein
MGLVGVLLAETILIAIKEKKRALQEKEEDDSTEAST